MRGLTGRKDPYEIGKKCFTKSEDVDMILDFLDENDMLDSRQGMIPLGTGSVLIPLWIKKGFKTPHRAIAMIWNRLLMMMWIPLLVLGIYTVLYSHSWSFISGSWGVLKGNLLGILLGMVLHEISHAAACLSYGGSLHEMGIITHFFMPGAYVMIDYDNVRNRFKRAQINAAGVECNLALAGVFFLLLRIEMFDSGMLIMAALMNIILAVFNMSLLKGLDGTGIVEELIGCREFCTKAGALFADFSNVRQLMRRGVNGEVTIVACMIIVLFQVLFPLIWIVNVISIVAAFF